MTWSAKCQSSETAAPLAGAAEASHAPTSPNPTATSAARLVSRISLSWLTSLTGFLPERQDASSALYHQGGWVGAFPKRQPHVRCRGAGEERQADRELWKRCDDGVMHGPRAL